MSDKPVGWLVDEGFMLSDPKDKYATPLYAHPLTNECGADPFENGYDPVLIERQYRDRIKALENEVARLKDKCDKQAMILRRLDPEKFPDTFFITGAYGNRDQNNMPDRVTICPAYGVDFSYVYEYTGTTMGCEW